MSDKTPMRIYRAVIRVTQSPMTAQRWCADLECGHEVWVTAKRKPVAKRMVCSACKEEGHAD